MSIATDSCLEVYICESPDIFICGNRHAAKKSAQNRWKAMQKLHVFGQREILDKSNMTLYFTSNIRKRQFKEKRLKTYPWLRYVEHSEDRLDFMYCVIFIDNLAKHRLCKGAENCSFQISPLTRHADLGEPKKCLLIPNHDQTYILCARNPGQIKIELYLHCFKHYSGLYRRSCLSSNLYLVYWINSM